MAQTPTPPRPKGVPPAPSQDYVDQVSEDQAMITDEWAPAPPPDEDETPGG
jgi:hypothetical protein